MYKNHCADEFPRAIERPLRVLASSAVPSHPEMDAALPDLQLGRLMKLRDLMVALKAPLANPLGVQAIIDGILFSHEAAARPPGRAEP